MTEPTNSARDAQPTAPRLAQPIQRPPWELPPHAAFGTPVMEAAEPVGWAGPPVPDTERVALGLLAALVGVAAGVALTVAIWRAGYVAAITSLVIAFGAAWLYTKAAGGPPRRGLVALVVLIILGVAVSFFAVVASDLMVGYDDAVAQGFVPAMGRGEFVRSGLIDSEVLSAYGKDMALFGVFAVLGVFGTVRRLVTAR